MKPWLALSLVVLVTGALAWANAPSVAGAVAGPAQEAPTVQLIPGGQKQPGNPGEKGATYYALEAQTTRLTTRFRDGHVAITERGLIGDVTTTLRDAAGNERARLRLNRIDGAHDMLHFEPSDGTPFQAQSDPSLVKPTLDWAAHQAYTLATDGTANLVWDNGSMRPKAAPHRDIDRQIDDVETVWANGLVARLTRQNYSRREIAPGRFVQGPVLVSELNLHGVPVGTAAWFERDQVLAYALPGLMTGLVVIGPEHLKANYGGWPFTPDTTWLNLQVIAARHFKTLAAKQGLAARACGRPEPNRLVQFFVPTVHANEVGCDDFHWLDGSMVRECCDDHDRCYEKSGCDQYTWWQIWRSWSCDRCNMAVVGCFFARGSMDDRCITRQGCAG